MLLKLLPLAFVDFWSMATGSHSEMDNSGAEELEGVSDLMAG